MITAQQLEKRAWKTFEEAMVLIHSKNADYASKEDGLKNFRGAEIIGISIEKAILVRILDKITRISNLLDRKAQVKDESIADSIVDAINYLAILKTKIEYAKK